MSHLKNKSDFNLQAADYLINVEDCYAPSVHCSYYGCFQYIKFKLNKIGHTYAQIDSDIQKSKQVPGGTVLSSNKYPLDLIVKKLRTQTDIIYSKKVNDKIKKLKTFRVLSDYEDVPVDYQKSTEALRLSKEIIKLIENKL